jgi:hypothetical protein
MEHPGRSDHIRVWVPDHSLFDGKYGVTDFSLLKAKALVAGLVFDTLLIIPALLGLRSYGLFGLSRLSGSNLPAATTRVQERCVNFIVLFGLYFSCCVLASFSKFLFAKPIQGFLGLPTILDGSVLAVVVGIVNWLIIISPVFVGGLSQKHLAVRPVQCAILSGLTALLWFVWLLRMGDPLIFELAGWLYLISLGAAFIGHHAAKPSLLMKIEWEWLPLYLTSFFVLWFANSIYGQIKPEFGGGYPTQGCFYLQQEIPAVSGKSFGASVIDETEQGFYVIPQGRDSKAIFIPRSIIMAIDFDIQSKAASGQAAPPPASTTEKQKPVVIENKPNQGSEGQPSQKAKGH